MRRGKLMRIASVAMSVSMILLGVNMDVSAEGTDVTDENDVWIITAASLLEDSLQYENQEFTLGSTVDTLTFPSTISATLTRSAVSVQSNNQSVGENNSQEGNQAVGAIDEGVGNQGSQEESESTSTDNSEESGEVSAPSENDSGSPEEPDSSAGDAFRAIFSTTLVVKADELDTRTEEVEVNWKTSEGVAPSDALVSAAVDDVFEFVPYLTNNQYNWGDAVELPTITVSVVAPNAPSLRGFLLGTSSTTTAANPPEAPEQPSVLSKTATTITIHAESGKEYLVCEKGHIPDAAEWDNSFKPAADGEHEFPNLNPKTSYDIYVRVCGDDATEPSPANYITVKTAVDNSATTVEEGATDAEEDEEEEEEDEEKEKKKKNKNKNKNKNKSKNKNKNKNEEDEAEKIEDEKKDAEDKSSETEDSASQKTSKNKNKSKSKSKDKTKGSDSSNADNESNKDSATAKARDNSNNSTEASTTIILGQGGVRITMQLDDSSKISAKLVDAEAVIKSILTKEQLARVEQGAAVDIRIEAKALDARAVPTTDKKTIEKGILRYKKNMPNLSMANYIDISMSLKFDDGDWEQIAATNAPIAITLSIPDDYRGLSAKYFVLRAHEGKCALLKDSDKNADTVTIATGRFSTYALMYDESAVSQQKQPPRVPLLLFVLVCAALLGETVYIVANKRKRA